MNTSKTRVVTPGKNEDKGLKKLRGMICILLMLLSFSSFTMPAFAAGTAVELNAKKNQISATNAVVYASIQNPTKATITDVGIVLKSNGLFLTEHKEKCNSAYKNSSSVPVWYDLTKEVKFQLDGGTTYSYTIYAVIGGKRYEASGSFKTSGNPSSVALQTGSNKVSQTNATLYGTIKNPNQSCASYGGIVIKQGGKVIKEFKESVPKNYRNAKTIPVSYDLTKEIGLVLTPNTAYTYELFGIVGGVRRSATGSFKTSAAQKASNVSCTCPLERPVGIQPTVFYSNMDTGYKDQCVANTNAMILAAVADPSIVSRRLKEAGYSDIRQYTVKNSIGITALAKQFGCVASQYTIATGKVEKEEETLSQILRSSKSKVGYLYFGKGNNSYGHAIMVYLDSAGSLKVNDPGFRSNKQAAGTSNWSGEGMSYSRSRNYWTGRGLVLPTCIIIVERMAE